MVIIRYFSRSLHNRLHLSSLFPFKDIDSVNLFWDDLYVADYKLNQVYYENLIKEAIPEITDKLVMGESIYSAKGPSEYLLSQLGSIDEMWKCANKEYRQHFEKIKDKLPSCVLKFTNEEIQEAMVVDLGMADQETVFLKLDTRFSELNFKGIDGINIKFCGVKSVKTKGAIQLQRWLYCEIDVPAEGIFEIRILFESGELLIIAEEMNCEFKERLSEFNESRY